MELDLEPVQVGELFVNSLAIIREKAATRRVGLTMDVADDLGSIHVDVRKVKQIAYNLNISEGTVKVYLSRLFTKLGVNDRFELALYGLKSLQAGYYAPLEPAASGLLALQTVLMNAGQDRASAAKTTMNPGNLNLVCV